MDIIAHDLETGDSDHEQLYPLVIIFRPDFRGDGWLQPLWCHNVLHSLS